MLPPENQPLSPISRPPRRLWVVITVVFGIMAYLTFLGLVLLSYGLNTPIAAPLAGPQGVIFTHFTAIVGTPMVAGLAFLVVLLLPQAYGEIEFKAIGITFKGAAGPVVLWLLCFLGMCAAIKLLW